MLHPYDSLPAFRTPKNSLMEKYSSSQCFKFRRENAFFLLM
jgi:hypothetical protein